jgi:hypothetical protein
LRDLFGTVRLVRNWGRIGGTAKRRLRSTQPKTRPAKRWRPLPGRSASGDSVIYEPSRSGRELGVDVPGLYTGALSCSPMTRLGGRRLMNRDDFKSIMAPLGISIGLSILAVLIAVFVFFQLA